MGLRPTFSFAKLEKFRIVDSRLKIYVKVVYEAF
jgi:hypothetical protein